MSSKKRRKKHTIIITGGGTGGHYYPAIAIADAILRLSPDMLDGVQITCHYIGSQYGIESRLVAEKDYPYTMIPVKGFSRYLSLSTLLRNMLLPFRLLHALVRTYALYRKLDPMATVATGGYVSGIPGYISNRMRIPLFVQEQNAFPGVTSRILAKRSMGFFYAYDAVKEHMKDDILYIKSGNPVRRDITRIDTRDARECLGLDPETLTLFIFGGSQGSVNINNYISKRIISWIYKYKIQVLWQTGNISYDMLHHQFGEHRAIHLLPYIENMSAAYSAADMVISRAGALTLAEIEKIRVPAILIPLPGAAGNHQFYNAKALEALGCAVVIEEKDFPDNPITPILNAMIRDPEHLKAMADAFPRRDEDAAEIIARTIINNLRSFYAWS